MGRPDGAERSEGSRKGGKGRKGNPLMEMACLIVNTTSGLPMKNTSDHCPQGAACNITGLEPVAACDNTFVTLTFCDVRPPMKDEDDEMMVDDDDNEEEVVSDEDSDEDSDESRERRHRGGCRRRGGLVKAACSLEPVEGDGISFTRDCPRNATCDLGTLILEVNGTTVAAKFCQAPEGAEERPCPEDRDGERSGRGGRRGGRRDDDVDDEATEVDGDAANGAPVELRSLNEDGQTAAGEAAREGRRGRGGDREAADADAGARGGRRGGRRQGGGRRGDRTPTDGDAPEGDVPEAPQEMVPAPFNP